MDEINNDDGTLERPTGPSGDVIQDVPEVTPYTTDESKVIDDAEVPMKDKGIRDFRITNEIIIKFGYTAGCARCDAMMNKDPLESRKRHNGK